MGKFKDFWVELKSELALYFKENIDNYIATLFGLCACGIVFFIIWMLVSYPPLMLSILVSLIFGAIIIMSEITIMDKCLSHTHFPLLRQIKHIVIRFVVYPILVVGWLWVCIEIWLNIKYK